MTLAERVQLARADEQVRRFDDRNEPADIRRRRTCRNPCRVGAPKGRDNGKSRRLNEDAIRSIRVRRAAGETLNAIASTYGITDGMVSRIVSGRAYAWVVTP